DTDYLPLIYSLARGQYSELADPASYGTGLLPFPIFSMLPYALCVAIFGDIGFVVADALIAGGRYLLVYSLLSYVTERKATAAVVAFAVILATYGSQGGWNFRYPRPYVTQLFLLVVTLTSVHLFGQLRKNELSILLAIGHGVVIGVAAQGDMYAAAGFVV